ncbi:MAG: MBL fold metallo-hydrolase [bacterium]
MTTKITTGKFQTNTYLLTNKDDCIVIDPGYNISEYLPKIKAKNVVAVLLTHCHCDHVDGIGNFDCPIYIHQDDFDSFKNENSLYDLLGDTPSFDYDKLNIKTFEDKEILNISKFNIEAIHTPGHTKGSTCFLYKDMLFSGDTLFKNSIGRTDFPSGNHALILNSINKLANGLDGKIKVFPGHGDETTIKEERRNNIFIKTI